MSGDHDLRILGKPEALGVERQGPTLLVGEHALAELRAQRRQGFADLGKPAARGRVEAGAGTAEGREVPSSPDGSALIAAIRVNSAWFMWIASQWAVRLGTISRSSTRITSLLWAPASAKKAADTRDSARPERSSAPMVLAKVGGAASAAIAATSPRWRASAASKAGPKWLGRIASNGGAPNGVFQSARRGLSPCTGGGEEASVMGDPGVGPHLRPLAGLACRAYFVEIAAANRT
jgi:hypothetical protein